MAYQTLGDENSIPLAEYAGGEFRQIIDIEHYIVEHKRALHELETSSVHTEHLIENLESARGNLEHALREFEGIVAIDRRTLKQHPGIARFLPDGVDTRERTEKLYDPKPEEGGSIKIVA